jgi:nitrate reductase NapE component
LWNKLLQTCSPQEAIQELSREDTRSKQMVDRFFLLVVRCVLAFLLIYSFWGFFVYFPFMYMYIFGPPVLR